jgi:hypothetical protein
MSALSRIGLTRAALAGPDRPPRVVLLGLLLWLAFTALLLVAYRNEPGPLCQGCIRSTCTDSAFPPPPGVVCR